MFAQKTYKVFLRIVFVHMNLTNPYIYHCKVLPYQKHYAFLTFMEKNQRNEKCDRDRQPAERDVASRFVCVCVLLCIPLFEPK